MRSVTLGPQQNDRVAIVKGLNPRETVVTDGADRLHEGGEVTIPSGQKVAKVAPAANAAALPRGTPSREERRARLTKTCGADIKKYCADSQGFAVMGCLRENVDSLGSECQTLVKSMHGRRSGGGGGGPPGP